jgi:hypothetical protein
MHGASPDFFPLTKGLTLEYRTRNAESSGLIKFEILDVAEKGNVTRAMCRRTTVWGTQVTVNEYPIVRDKTGVYAEKEREFPLPPVLGRKWRHYPNEYRISAFDGITSVPAGTFRNCMKVSYLIAGGDGGVGERFYAPGVGLVRENCLDEADPFEIELVRKTAPLTTVRFK